MLTSTKLKFTSQVEELDIEHRLSEDFLTFVRGHITEDNV